MAAGADVGLLEIFLFIALSSLFSLGGGNGQIPVIQGQWVEPGVLAPSAFSFALAIAYLAPGPKSGFIAGIGYYLAGLPGAVVAVAGLVLPTCLGATGVSLAVRKVQTVVRLVRPSSGFVLAALIAAAAWGTAEPLALGVGEMVVVAVVAVVVVWRDLDPVWLMLGAIGVGALWSIVRVMG